MLQVLDAEAVHRWCAAACEDLAAARTELDDSNVYPVPDGDTGTNLLLTLEAVHRHLAAENDTGPGAGTCDVGPGASTDDTDGAGTEDARRRTGRALWQGALLGARGNSGVIVSQLLRGIAEQLCGGPPCDAAGLQRALARGVALAYAAVSVPVEGTVLTVARDSAEAATATSGDLPAVLRAAVTAAGRSLARTPELLPELAAAGVVDAGGRGWCVLLGALERVVTGEPTTVVAPTREGAHPGTSDVPGAGPPAEGHTPGGSYAYEVQYLLRETGPARVRALTMALEALGDSVVVVGGGGDPGGAGGEGGSESEVDPESRNETECLYNVHVHVDDVGAALEAGLDAGRPFRVSVTRFAEQGAADPGRASSMVDPVPEGAAVPAGARRTVVAVASGAGLHALLARSGACVVEGSAQCPPGVEQLLQAVVAGGGHEVVLLPDGPTSAVAAAGAATAARATGRTVAVVPTRSVLQGMAALAVADPQRPFADDVASMAEAAGSTRTGQVCLATGPAATSAGLCRAGDVLGVLADDVAVVGHDVEAVAAQLIDRLLGAGGELVTLVRGAELDPQAVARLRERVERGHPAVEVLDYDGGQVHVPLLLAVE